MATAFVLKFGWLDGVVQDLASLGLAVIVLVMVVWDRRRRGTYPRGLPPRDFLGLTVVGLLAIALVTGMAWLIATRLNVWAAAAFAGISVAALELWYEHAYAAVSARIRERLK